MIHILLTIIIEYYIFLISFGTIKIFRLQGYCRVTIWSPSPKMFGVLVQGA